MSQIQVNKPASDTKHKYYKYLSNEPNIVLKWFHTIIIIFYIIIIYHRYTFYWEYIFTSYIDHSLKLKINTVEKYDIDVMLKIENFTHKIIIKTAA